jgi:FkbM family methyltransferase
VTSRRDPAALKRRLIRMITRHYPFLSGCTFPNHPAFVAFTGAPPTAEWTAVSGGDVLARHDDFIGRCAYYVGDLDRKVSAIFDRFVKQGDVVVDVGANIGVTTLRLAALVGESGRVHAFEPNPQARDDLRSALERREIRQATIHPYALGKTSGTVALAIPAGNAGAASIVPGRVPDSGRSQSVELRTLDSLFPDLGALRLIKIDAEGAEADVIAGGLKLIERCRSIILFESNDGNRRVIDEHLTSVDYATFGIKRTLFKLDFARVGAVAAGFHDYLAAPRETAHLIVGS